jgi:uncharacterized protein (UPF0332 family)
VDSEHKIYLKRSENELNLSFIIHKISDDTKMQIDIFGVKEDTYYSAVIAHAYYSIFYAAKAYLILLGTRTRAPEEHRKTYDEFSKLVDKGIIDVELLKIYHNTLIKADNLLQIYSVERSKRGMYTYHRIARANKEPANESTIHAKRFFGSIALLCEKA